MRNQTVLIRGVNDDPRRMKLLARRLGHVNVHPYYVYMHDMVKGVEELRTTLATAVDTEKFVRGSTAGSTRRRSSATRPAAAASATSTPLSITIATTASPCMRPKVKPGKAFLYFDPIDTLGARRPGPLGRPAGLRRRDDPRSNRQRGSRQRPTRSSVKKPRSS